MSLWLSLSVLAVAGIMSAGVYGMASRNHAEAIQKIKASQHADTSETAQRMDVALRQIYQNIRTLTFLPDIRSLDRHASNVGQSARQTIQQIYNNLASDVSVSEIYFVPASFTPGKIDPDTGSPEEPAMMYDELIAWEAKTLEETKSIEGQPEIEDEEYALITRQIAALKEAYPDTSNIDGMNIPMVSGKPVVTCDNTDFNMTLKDHDREGIVFSVPYYDRMGKFAGVVSAVVRLRVLEKFLPEKDAALVNVGEGYAIYSGQPGQALKSQAHTLKGRTDPDLIYSETRKLAINDISANWTVWRGVSNEEVMAEPDVTSARDLALMSYGVIGLLSLLALCAIHFADRRYVRPANRVVGALMGLAQGNIDAEIPMSDRRDILGDISRAVVHFRESSLQLRQSELERVERAQKDLEEQVVLEQQATQRARDIMLVVRHLGDGLQRLAECNIRMTIDQPFVEEFEQIRHDFNRSIQAFQITLEEVMSSTETVRAHGADMLNASHDLALQAERQASAIEQSSAALEQISVTVSETRSATENTRNLVREARQSSSQSAPIVGQTIEAMQRIEQSSGEIGNIISLIDQIAFQTNLLALNAGVEAARAGEAGKGFAVVAQEVRELAQRSSAAARQIKELVEKSGREVANGVLLVGQTGEALGAISRFVTEIDQNMDHIATSIAEQASGLSEITTGLNAIDTSTQHNAAASRLTADLSEAVSRETNHLAALIQRFKLNRRSAQRDPDGEVWTEERRAQYRNSKRGHSGLAA